MNRWIALLVLGLAAGCGAAQEHDPCFKSFSSVFSGDEGSCAEGLVCIINDSCQGTCEGTCVRRCSVDADCAAGATCTGNITPENGFGNFCLAPRPR